MIDFSKNERVSEAQDRLTFSNPNVHADDPIGSQLAADMVVVEVAR